MALDSILHLYTLYNDPLGTVNESRKTFTRCYWNNTKTGPDVPEVLVLPLGETSTPLAKSGQRA